MSNCSRSGKTGASLALAAAAILSLPTATAVSSAQESNTAAVKCYGVNSCRGQSDCRTAHSSCRGLNSCRGLGYVGLTSRVCDQVGGVDRDATGKKES